jgi:hypothetical protein
MCKQLKPCGGGSCCHPIFEKLLDESYDREMRDTIREVKAVVADVRKANE